MAGPEAQSISLAAVGRSAVVLAGSALIVQVLGFLRQLFLAAEVGISAELDAFLIALAAPLAATGVLVAGVQVALVPSLTEAKEERGVMAARNLAGLVLVWISLASMAVGVFLWIFAEEIISITGPGLADEGTAREAVRYLRMLTPLTVLGAATSIYYPLCQAESLFGTLAVSTVAGPFLTFALMVYYWDELGLTGLAVGTIIGAAVSLAVPVASTIRRGVGPLPRLRRGVAGTRDLIGHAVPLSLSAAILQVNLMVDRALASLLASGGVSALAFGESLVRVPFAAIRPAWNTALYPTLVRAGRVSGNSALADTTNRVLGYTVAFFLPLAVLTVAVAPLATAAAYDRGSFSAGDLSLTSQVVAASAPLIVLWMVAPTLVAALNARRKGGVLLGASAVNLIVNVVLDILLGYAFGVVGIALATTGVSLFMVWYLGLRLSREEPRVRLRLLGRTLTKATIASLPAALVFGIPIWLGYGGESLFERLALLAVVGVAGLTSYYVIALRLGMVEAGAIVRFGFDSVRRVLARVRLGA